MSGSETTHAELTHQHLAFDYVTGTMRGRERLGFQARLARDKQLQAEVNYWEEQLMALSDRQQALPPKGDTWNKIAARIESTRAVNSEKSERMGGWRWWRQGAVALAGLLLITAAWLITPAMNTQQLNADYVAVLTDTAGAPQLTVLTSRGGEQLWLKWEGVTIPEDKSLQLWAVSKRDGQMRPLGVFDRADIRNLALTVPQYRLIKDSSHLLLTEEDVGGSPLDEPSDVVVAKGVCVLLAETDKTI